MRAGAPLQRRTPLARSPMKRRTSRRVARKSDSDKAYTAWIHGQYCVGYRLAELALHNCGGRVEQSHMRHHTGLGLKAPDTQSVPMCTELHLDWEQRRGWFHGWSNLERFAWMTKRIAETLAAYLADGGVLA